MAAQGLEYQSDGPHRPSFRFRHTVCGSDMGRFEMANGSHAYVCETCETTIPFKGRVAGEIERYRAD